MKKQNKMFKRK